jgi:hypothetical protein
MDPRYYYSFQETPSPKVTFIYHLLVVIELFNSWGLVVPLLHIASLDLSICTSCSRSRGRNLSSSGCEGGVGAGSRGSRLLLFLLLLGLRVC